ncbi:MAG TPA: hypothetical protein ENF51_00110 [Candidatus Aenigmarchaeota archaeon]|nr:hypothetical protein [Candidatus Aenigmarchaeota archaeon]
MKGMSAKTALLAFVLIIAVAIFAGYAIIWISNELGYKAVSTGESYGEKIGSNVEITGVLGVDSDMDKLLDSFVVLLHNAGSSYMNYSDVVISIYTNDWYGFFTYAENATYMPGSNYEVNIVYDKEVDGLFSPGDIIEVCIVLDQHQHLPANRWVRLAVLYKGYRVSIVNFRTSFSTGKYTSLYPASF